MGCGKNSGSRWSGSKDCGEENITVIQAQEGIHNPIQLELSKLYARSNKKIKKTLVLPIPISGDFSEYRIMDDAETEDKEFWKELEIDGEKLPSTREISFL